MTLLYVEDDDLIREEAVEYLSLLYHNVLEAQNGQEALELYEKHKPDIIITDIEMPIINGLQLTRVIRRKNKDIPIIIVTAFLEVEYLVEAVSLHLVKYVVKPITPYKLDTALSLAHEYLDKETIESTILLSEKSSYDRLNRTLIIDDKVIQLTHNEIILFELLLEKANTIVTYDEIKIKIWSYENHYMDALRSLIRSLRSRIEDIKIKNISGIGYRLVVQDNFKKGKAMFSPHTI